MPRLIFSFLLCFNLCSCVYLNVKSPLDKNVNKTILGSKIGTSKTQSILWMVAWGDGGTAAAARDGGITTITHLDVRYYTVLFGLYAVRETIAYGE